MLSKAALLRGDDDSKRERAEPGKAQTLGMDSSRKGPLHTIRPGRFPREAVCQGWSGTWFVGRIVQLSVSAS
jgi:hypothetical protein